MNDLVFLFDDITTCKVKLNSQEETTYTYKCLKDTVSAGDQVVVATSRGTTIAKVTEVHEYPDVPKDKVLKWIVQVVDLTKYNELVKRDGDFKSLIARANFLQKQEEVQKRIAEGLPVNEIERLQKLLGKG